MILIYFFQTFQPPMLIDEVQYATQLFPYIKMMADISAEKGLFWITGYQQFLFLSYSSIECATLIPLITSWFSIAADSLLHGEITIKPPLFFIDELHNFKRLSGLETIIIDAAEIQTQ